VSKSWQSLCLDGQLWSLVHLAPFAPHMHTTTIRRIIFHAAPFISSL
jgi:F-box/leucine-rich repeat protein 2/20